MNVKTIKGRNCDGNFRNYITMKTEQEKKILITYTNAYGVSVTAKVTQEHLNRLSQIYTVYLIK
jgi:hypothetical protein